MTHGHEVLKMMQGHSYSEEGLLKAILEKFGSDERFYTCCADNLTAQELIEFLRERGKFMPMDGGFSVDSSNVCIHDQLGYS